MSAVIRGNAVVTIATSSAEMKARRQRAKKMPQKRRLNGFFAGRLLSDVITVDVIGELFVSSLVVMMSCAVDVRGKGWR
jgi:hypothetical protein